MYMPHCGHLDEHASLLSQDMKALAESFSETVEPLNVWNRKRSPRPWSPELLGKEGHLEVVALLTEGRGDREARYNGATALYISALRGYVPIVKRLMVAGADKDAATPSGETALFVATLRGKDEVVQALLEGKANVNKATADGATPLLVASQEGRKQCLRLLLEAGAEMGKRMTSGETPLGLACSEEVKDLFFTTKPPHSLLRRLHSP
ncbi:Ank3 [Symbiodinium sp. CCMP2592]|nr:Ank3 [Symbiodinium sp. CCMP2592]